MRGRTWLGLVLSGAALVSPAGLSSSPTAPPEAPAAQPVKGKPTAVRLTLDEAKQRVVANSKLLALAATNVEGKGYATKAMRAQSFPQVIGSTVYFHFNDDLGSVVTTPGRKVTGPLGPRTLGQRPQRDH